MAKQICTKALSPRQALDGQRVRRIPGLAMKVATWNVRSLFVSGKLDNLVLEMERLKINMLGVSDVQWTGSGKCPTKNGTMYFSGNNNPNHRYGVAIIVDKVIDKSVIGFTPLSDRVMMLKLQASPTAVNVIQVYAPTADKSDQEIETFYEELREALQTTKNHELTIILGDFNAKVGQGEVENCVGKFGLGQRNERGDRLVEFCQTENLIITNTFFKLPNRRLYTWKSPADGIRGIVRNQIDFILIKERYKNSVKSVKTYPGADIDSDHNPLIAKIELKFKKTKPKTTKHSINVSSLKDPVVRQKTKREINKNLKSLTQTSFNHTDVNRKWDCIQNIMDKAGSALPNKREAKQLWMNEEILKLMDERRQNKNNINEYAKLNSQIKIKIKHAKEEWLKRNCEEIEEYEKRYDSFNMHKRIKEMTGLNKHKVSTVLKNREGKLLTDVNEQLTEWTNYIKILFYDTRPELSIDFAENTGPEILKEEVLHAIQQTKSGKASGPDEIPIELLKLIDSDSIDIIVDLFNAVYTTGIIPKEWLQSTFITLPKKPNAKCCSEYRTISLMSHTLKVLLRIIHNRIYAKLDMDISDNQLGFRKGMGTREALFGLNVLMQRCLDVNQDIYICFIDFEKAFDRVQHEKLIEILQRKNIDTRDIRLIANLYWGQTARVRLDDYLSENIEIQRGVRQGCILSPLLFNVYSETIFEEALAEGDEGIKINGQQFNNFRYADDTVVTTDSIEDLQNLLQRINDSCKRYGLNMNLKKTKYMVITKQQNIDVNLTIDNTPIERVQHYKYLGTIINETAKQLQEIKARVEIARRSFIKLKKFLCSKNINLKLRTRILRCYVFSTLLYGAEAWTLKTAEINKLVAFERWCYRRMLRISWVDRVTNVEVLRRMNKEEEIYKTLKKKKLEYFAHIIRGPKYQLLQNIMEGKIQGKRCQGRRRTSWLRNLREWFSMTSNELFRAAANKVRIAMLIANLR